MANSLAPPNLFVDTTATAYTGAGWMQAITVRNNNPGAQVSTIYDNTSAAGQKLVDVEIPGTNSIQLAWGSGVNGKHFGTGLHVVPGTNCTLEITLG